MGTETVYHTIREAIHSFLPQSRILLYGAHARGDHNSQSDYDLLIITPKMLAQKEKLSMGGKIDKEIIKAIHAPVSLLIYSEEEVQQKQQLPGHIVRAAMKEGKAL